MQIGNTQRHEIWDDEVQMNNIIYLPYRYAYDPKRSRRNRRRRANRADTVWNAIFAALCLSVLVVLFLH